MRDEILAANLTDFAIRSRKVFPALVGDVEPRDFGDVRFAPECFPFALDALDGLGGGESPWDEVAATFRNPGVDISALHKLRHDSPSGLAGGFRVIFEIFLRLDCPKEFPQIEVILGIRREDAMRPF